MMNTFGRYLEYKLRKALPQMLVVTVLSMVITLMTTLTITSFTSFTGRANPLISREPIWVLIFLLCADAFLFSFLEIWDLRSRNHIDVLYSFPIERRVLAAVHYVSGLLQMCAVFTVTFFSSFVILCLRTEGWYDFSAFIGLYFGLLALGLFLYSLVAFFMQVGNSVLDSLLITLLWLFSVDIRVPFYFLCVRCDLISKSVYEMVCSWWTNPVTFIANTGERLVAMVIGEYYEPYLPPSSGEWYHFLVWGVLGAVAVVGYFFLFCRKRPEKIGGISDSWLGYKLLIPLCGYSGIIYMIGMIGVPGALLNILLILFYVICMVVGYVIYRRGFRFRWSDWICLACAAIPIALTECLPFYH